MFLSLDTPAKSHESNKRIPVMMFLSLDTPAKSPESNKRIPVLMSLSLDTSAQSPANININISSIETKWDGKN